MIARTAAILTIVASALLGSSTAASAEMVLARSLIPKSTAQPTVKVKRQLRRSMRRAARRGASDQRGRAAVRAKDTPARAAASPAIDSFAARFNAAFPATKGD